MGEIIGIVSGKGGVGKTAVTANLAGSLAILGKKVIAIDGDIGLRNLDIAMGLEDRVLYNIIDVIENNCKLSQAVIRDKRYGCLYFLPTAQFLSEGTKINSDKIFNIYNLLKQQFDYVLIDAPTGLNEIFRLAICNIDRALVVLEQDTSSIRDADRVIRTMRNQGINKAKLIFNKYEIQENFNIEYIAEDLCVDILGTIPYSRYIKSNMNNGKMIDRDNITDIDRIFLNIAKKVIER